MKTLLLCGYRPQDEMPLGLGKDASGQTLLDHRVRQLQSLGHEPLVVLAGPTADQLLRQCKTLPQIEIAYDTNAGEANLCTNLKTGLTAIDGEPCFVLPLEIPCPSAQTFHLLLEHAPPAAHQDPTQLIQARDAQGAPWHFGFPLLVTRAGNREIRRLKGLNSLSDTRLQYLHIVMTARPEVASPPQDL